MLKESKTVQSPNLNLDDDKIGAAVAQALAMLKESSTLQTLRLTRGVNRIRGTGAQALAPVADAFWHPSEPRSTPRFQSDRRRWFPAPSTAEGVWHASDPPSEPH